jgi:hypothetical protein
MAFMMRETGPMAPWNMRVRPKKRRRRKKTAVTLAGVSPSTSMRDSQEMRAVMPQMMSVVKRIKRMKKK